MSMSLILICTGLSFANSDVEDNPNDINAAFGSRFVSSGIIDYTSSDADAGAFVSVGYSRRLVGEYFIDFRVSAFGAGSSDQKEADDGTSQERTQWLIYVEPSVGFTYKYRYVLRIIAPFVDFGGTFVYARLKNNVRYDINETATGYGAYAGLGLGVAISGIEYILGGRYTYLPVSFNDDIEGNIGGTDVYIKACLTF